MDTMGLYRRAQDGFDAVMAAVPADKWDAPSACSEWTVRDVAGHMISSQHHMRAWATGEEYTETAGGPGAPNPGVLAGDDPVATWRAAREGAEPTLTDEALGRMISVPGLGELPLAAIVTVVTTDHLVHSWDIAHPLGLEAELDPELVALTFDWAKANLVRQPVFFGPEVTPPADADEQTRMLAFLGRANSRSA